MKVTQGFCLKIFVLFIVPAKQRYFLVIFLPNKISISCRYVSEDRGKTIFYKYSKHFITFF